MKDDIRREFEHDYRQKARLNHYHDGTLYYDVTLSGMTYQFPVIIHPQTEKLLGEEKQVSKQHHTVVTHFMISMLRMPTKHHGFYYPVMEARHLLSWMDEAIEKNEFKKI